jgi:hypothetical protein
MKRAWIVLGAAFLAMPAAANDSTAETAAGGLVLTRSAEIDMVSEDLFVSAGEIRVRYVFRNRTARAVRTTIAFPMPDRDLSLERERDVAFPSDFSTKVNGAAVAMRLERKAMLRGTDQSALLKGLRIPLSDDPKSTNHTVAQALDALSPTDQARLVRLKLAEAEDYDSGSGMRRHFAPMWTVRESWYWEQVFPAGHDLVVEHRYKPGTGGSVGSALPNAGFRASPEGRSMIARYCVDSAFLAGVDRLARRAGRENAILPEERIGYVLTTGANWRAPIGDFRLVVDKGAPENLVSFCGQGLRRIGPTRFEMRRTNWRPDRDLNVLIVKPNM